MAGSTISTPVILSPLLCLADDDPNKANMISSIMFISGAVTLLQSTFGTRLPIIQGGSFSFIVVSIAILSQPHFKCPDKEIIDKLDLKEKEKLFHVRMREIQGAIIVASLFEVLIGFFGIVGMILKWITPMAVAPAITMIGLSLFKVSAKYSAGNWGISLLTMFLIIIFSQYCKDVKIPIPFTKDPDTHYKIQYPVFQVFPVLLAIAITWILCYILTETDVLTPGNKARTDINTKIVSDTLWFRIPQPFEYGAPTISLGAVLGMLAGVIAGTVESIGDYYACARISGAGPPPIHAINRGIFVEGVGCVLAGIFATGTGTTSLSQNIGAIGISKVGSRRVIQSAGLIMVVFALVGKVGAVFVSIPEPIIGGIFCVVFATVSAVGLSNLQGVDLNSSRNIFIIGFSIFFGLTISQWMESNSNSIQTGSETLDQIITILLKTGMFVSFFLGFILDNTIPGSPAERGLVINAHDRTAQFDSENNRDPSYDLPFLMPFIERFNFFKLFPISPTHDTKKNSNN